MKMEIEIQRVGLEGQGVGYDADLNIYFVPGAVPGDFVEVEFPDGAKKYRDAELVKIVRPSPDRKPSRCVYFGKCGGCDWLQWSYEAQLKAKDATLKHTFERNQVVPEHHLSMIAAEEIYGYRNRIQLRSEGREIGFLERGTHNIVDIKECIVAHPALNKALGELRGSMASSADRIKIEMGVNPDGTVTRWDNQPHGAGGFVQINAAQNEKLRALVAERVGAIGARKVLELFCGNGNLTFAFAPFASEVVGVDASYPAIEAARAAAVHVKTANVSFLKAPVNHELMKRLPAEWRGSYDTLVLDPPRLGAGDLRPFIHPDLKTIVYISCSPVAFAKEVAILKRDFRFEQAQPLDMFPHTRHIEFVATLKRV